MKDTIIAAARTVFLREGYHASIDAIIAEVGIARQTLYNHFKDKRSLFAAVIEASALDTMKPLHTLALANNVELGHALRQFGDAYMLGMLHPDNLAMTRLISTSIAEYPDAGRVAYQSGPERSIALLGNYLRAQHASGKIHCPAPELIAESFYGALVGPARFRYLLGINVSTSAAQRRNYIREIVNLYVAGLRGCSATLTARTRKSASTL